MGTRHTALHLVTIGHVMCYPPEGINALEATEKALTSEINHRAELEAYYRHLWAHWIKVGSSKSCAGSAAKPGVSIWVCRGKVPAVRDWDKLACLVRRPDYSLSIPSTASEAELSRIAGDILADIRRIYVSKTTHPPVNGHTAAIGSNLVER